VERNIEEDDVFIVFGVIELRDFVSTVRSPQAPNPRKGAARLIGQKSPTLLASWRNDYGGINTSTIHSSEEEKSWSWKMIYRNCGSTMRGNLTKSTLPWVLMELKE
jgi:hypothetical protein